MAGTPLILRYQWRAYWRLFFRTGRAKFHFTVVALLGWLLVFELPRRLSDAARALAAGHTASMDGVLLALCVLWLFFSREDANISLSSRRLRRFPLGVRTLIEVRTLSLFCSPVVWMIALGSLVSLFPFLSAPHPLAGSLAALLLFALSAGLGIGVSQLPSVAEWSRWVVVPAAIVGVALAAFGLAAGPDVQHWRDGVAAANPARQATAAAIASTTPAVLAAVGTVFFGAALVGVLNIWSFRHFIARQAPARAAWRATSRVRLPGRLGGLVRKEQHEIARVLDLWLGLLLALAAGAVSFFASRSATVHQAIMVMVCAVNVNVTLNCFGLDRPAVLNRYLIFPIRGQDLLLAKNLAIAGLVALQLSPLIAMGAWQSGPAQVGGQILVAMVLVLSHLAWGNVVSVFEPIKMQPCRFAPGGEPVTGLFSALIGSAPAVGVMVLLRSDAPMAGWAVAAIVLLAMVAYRGALRYAGRRFERRIEAISDRLA
jgi:hypothetical protein